MRVTNTMMSLGHSSAIQSNLQKVSKVNESLNTMKNVNRLSDDPYKAVKILNMNNEISGIEKYKSNCDEAVGWLDSTDNALDGLSSLSNKIKESLISAGNGTYSDDELNTISLSVNETMKEIANVLNTSHGGKYIFSGTDTGEPPIIYEEMKDPDTGNTYIELKINPEVDPQKLKENLNMQISQGIDVNYNVNLEEIIPNLDAINEISKDLAKRDEEALKNITTTHIDTIDKLHESVVNTRSVYGTKTNTVESMGKKNEEDLIQVKDVLSKNQDVDFGEKLIELKQAELVYTASLQTGSKVLTTSILNYL